MERRTFRPLNGLMRPRRAFIFAILCAALIVASAALASSSRAPRAAKPSARTVRNAAITTHSTKTKVSHVRIAAPRAPGTVLFDQYNNAGTLSTVSQDFEPANAAFSAFLADDFIVPAATTWTVTGVDAQGVYFNGPGPAVNFNVFFYANSGTLPGTVVATRLANSYTGGASPVITLTSPVTLSAGTYWVSVQARMDFTPAGEWGWTDRTVTSNSPAAWENPGAGFGTPCTAWGARGATCLIDAAAHNTAGPLGVSWASSAAASSTISSWVYRWGKRRRR